MTLFSEMLIFECRSPPRTRCKNPNVLVKLRISFCSMHVPDIPKCHNMKKKQNARRLGWFAEASIKQAF